MKSIDLKKELTNKLTMNCMEHFKYLKKELSSDSIFSYTLYCSSGCRSIGVAVCTRESLKLKNESFSINADAYTYNEVNASEWNYVNKHYELFDSTDDFIEKLYDIFYEGELEDINLDEFNDDELWEFISDFFIDVSIQTLKSLKEQGCFNTQGFEKDILLGMQFGDPDIYSLDMIEKSSEKTNSLKWHKKVVFNCNLMRDAAEY